MPSEAQALKWDQIAWKAKRISIIDSSKTEHHANRGIRLVPLLPDLERELLLLLAEAKPKEENVFPGLRTDSKLRTSLEKLITKAVVKQWPKLWQNLRASGCTDFARNLPSHVAAAICVHTEQIAKEHYWQVSDADLDSVIKQQEQTRSSKPQQALAKHRTEVKTPGKSHILRGNDDKQMDDIGLERV